MQDKNLPNVKEILLSLADYVGVKGIRGLAVYLQLSENRLYSWINRGSIGDTGAVLKKIPNARVEWLETGEGPMLTDSGQTNKSIYSQPEDIYQTPSNAGTAREETPTYSAGIDTLMRICKDNPLIKLIIPAMTQLPENMQLETFKMVSDMLYEAKKESQKMKKGE